MEYLPGGNLLALLRYDVLLREVAKFYMAETVLAIEAVHQFGIIHRYSPTLNLVEELLMYLYQATSTSSLTVKAISNSQTSALPHEQ